MLRLWNSATKSLQTITPIARGHIGLYACGPTVYQRAHIGNLRTYVLEDVLRRTLEDVEGLRINHVMNITDVGHLVGDGNEGDDKVEKSARDQGESAWDIAARYTRLFVEDVDRLNIRRPTVMPNATDHIAEQIALVEELERKGYTYATSDGIYFDTFRFTEYGKLSGQRLEEKEAGARVEINTEKRNTADFALWKFSPKNTKRQMEWESPWGVGFPGWHIECSAMSRAYLGQPFDIHAGGVDHIPIHHENEIAQSVAAYGVPLAHTWTHIEFLLVDGHKMSKSLKNDYSLDDVVSRGFTPLAYRYFLLGAHYRTKQNFTWEALEGAQHAITKLYSACRALPVAAEQGIIADAAYGQFIEALEHDLNTPQALAVMWKLLESEESDAIKASTLLTMDRILGLGLNECVGRPVVIPLEIQRLAEDRQQARMSKDWARSDTLREALRSRGWDVRDQEDGYTLAPR
jgi:cysteinyl-tRNA synthetase